MKDLICVGYNAGGKLGSFDTLCAFVDTLSIVHRSWSIVFVSELDGSLSETFSEKSVRGHTVFRHWPGHGSRAMAFIVNRSVRRHVRRTVWQGRAGSMHVFSNPSSRFHGAHSDLLASSLCSLSACIKMVKTRGARCARMFVVSDTNVDFLPLLSCDPCTESFLRLSHHADRRTLLENWAETFSLAVELPARVDGVPGGEWSEYCMRGPITRVPIGEQGCLPSCIDYAICSPGIVLDSGVDWRFVDADHAFVVYHLDYHFTFRASPRRLWQVSDEEAALQAFENVNLQLHWDVLKISDIVVRVQNSYEQHLSCTARRKMRMPFDLRQMYRYAATSSSNDVREMWQKRAQARRRTWVAERRVQNRLRAISCGRVLQKAKKLYPIKSVPIDGIASSDYDRGAEHLASKFAVKWGCTNLQAHEQVSNILAASDGVELEIDINQVTVAFSMLRRRHHRDWSGVTVRGLHLLFQSQPLQFVSWITAVMADNSRMQQLQVHARGFGKEGGNVAYDNVRVVVPLTSLMQLIDAILFLDLNVFVSKVFKPLDEIWEGAQPKTQVQDIVGGLSCIVEKDLDLESQSAISQADVRQHYDSVSLLLVHNWLLRSGCNPFLASSALRHQLLPSVLLHVGPSSAAIGRRTRGCLTGSRVASVLGRIPVQDVLRSNLHKLRPLCFSVDGKPLVACTFVDNVMFAGRSTFKACRMGDIFEEELSKHWNQAIKPSSRTVMPTFGNEDRSPSRPHWQVVQNMFVLDHLLQDSGSVSLVFQHVIKLLWRSFFANAKAMGTSKLPASARVKLIERATRPHVDQHCVRWPFTHQRAEWLDIIQRKMLASVSKITPLEIEEMNAFLRRRGRLVRKLQNDCTAWSSRWARHVCLWDDHIRRSANSRTWTAQLLLIRSPSELAIRRAVLGRPRTRNQPGFCCTRWYEAVAKAREWCSKHNIQIARRGAGVRGDRENESERGSQDEDG